MWGLYFDCELPHKQQRQKRKLGHSYDLHCSYNKNKFLRSSANDSCYGYLTEIHYKGMDQRNTKECLRLQSFIALTPIILG